MQDALRSVALASAVFGLLSPHRAPAVGIVLKCATHRQLIFKSLLGRETWVTVRKTPRVCIYAPLAAVLGAICSRPCFYPG